MTFKTRVLLSAFALSAMFANCVSAEELSPSAQLKYLMEKLHLKPIPAEGGFFTVTYTADAVIPDGLDGRGARHVGGGIYFLLTPETFSAMHRLKSDEVYHFYGGSPVEMLQLLPDGSSKKIILGPELWNGQEPQVVVKHGTWQGSHLIASTGYALMGTTMAPAFDPADFELAKRAELIKLYPKQTELITKLTR
jgi:predicted cupin superfamily sugar epimerase